MTARLGVGAAKTNHRRPRFGTANDGAVVEYVFIV